MFILFTSFSNAKTKIPFTPWKHGWTKGFKFGFCLNYSGFDRYLFKLNVVLKPDFNCGNFALSWVDKVNTGMERFVSVISNVAPWVATLVYKITQFAEQVKISLTSQLSNGFSRVFRKLLKYFNGTIISKLSISPSSSVWPVIFALKLNESVTLAPLKSTISPLLFTAGIALQYCHKLPDVLE